LSFVPGHLSLIRASEKTRSAIGSQFPCKLRRLAGKSQGTNDK
jgi:hypothetical protein